LKTALHGQRDHEDDKSPAEQNDGQERDEACGTSRHRLDEQHQRAYENREPAVPDNVVHGIMMDYPVVWAPYDEIMHVSGYAGRLQVREPSRLEAGMDVLSSDGEKLGRVKEILAGGGFFRVDCPFAPDYYVPVDEIARTEHHTVHLQASKVQAANMGWEVRPKGP